MKNKEKIPLFIALSIPILMVLFLAASIYLPALGVQPKTNFLYSQGDEYSRTKYYVQDNHLLQRAVEYPEHFRAKKEVRIFIYDVHKRESREIPYEQAQSLVLDSRVKSPDGFEVITDHSGGYDMFPFFYSRLNYGEKYLKKGNYSRKLEINQEDSSRYYYGHGFNFIGWIIQGE